MRTEPLDELDWAIIRALQDSPSRTNKDIGETLAISEPTVANRIRSLEASKTLRVMMQRDLRAMGLPLVALVDIHVEGRIPEDVATDLAKLDCCTSVSIAMSNPDIFLNINAADGRALQRIIDEQISTIEGIASYEINAALEVVKLDTRYGSLKAE